MSHRCIIATHIKDVPLPDAVRAIYCHSGGDLADNGEILAAHYTTPEKVNALLDLGSLSLLGYEVGTEPVPDGTPRSAMKTVAYVRDRGDLWGNGNLPRDYKTSQELDEFAEDMDCEIIFLFCEGRWYYDYPAYAWRGEARTTLQWKEVNNALAILNRADESDFDHWH